MRPLFLIGLFVAACDPTPAPGPEPALPETCDEVADALAAELEAIQTCTTDDECGQVLTGTSCGCTRNLVARLDADVTRFYDLLEQQGALECDGLFTTCDCPPADGFSCTGGRCGWNYTRFP